MLFVCLGSATDVPEQAPELAKNFTTVDTYDNHHEIPKHRAAMDAAAREGDNIAMISTGWDSGLFSLNRVLGAAILSGADLKGNECHLRHCFVVAEETGNADEDAKLKEQIRETIVTMPDYLAPYETIVDFISEEEFDRDHQGMPHGGGSLPSAGPVRPITSSSLASTWSATPTSPQPSRLHTVALPTA